MSEIVSSSQFVENIRLMVAKTREQIATTINTVMVATYWEIGKRIVEEEQQGKEKAEYGTTLIADLNRTLRGEFGKGFSERNLRYILLVFPIWQTVSAKLSWSHSI